MVLFDRREDFEASDADLEAVAAECHALYESKEFEMAVAEALDGAVSDYIDGDVVDAAATEAIREFMAQEAVGALFQYRNQIVTNAQADLEQNDIIRMESARDPERTIRYVAHTAKPDDTGVRAYRVPDDADEEPRTTDHGAGSILFCDRYEVDKAYRDLDASAFRIARKLARGELGKPEVEA